MVASRRSGLFKSRSSRMRGAIAQLHLVTQPHLVEREQTGFDPAQKQTTPPSKQRMTNQADHVSRSTASSGRCFCVQARGFFEQHFLDPFAAHPPDGDGEARNFEPGADGRQITEPVENVTADRVDAVGVQLEAEMFA